MNSTITFRRNRGVAEVVNVTFRFLRRHVRPLGKALLFITAPGFVLASAIISLVQVSNVRGAGDLTGTAAGFLGLGMLLGAVMSVAASALLVSVTYEYVRGCIRGEAEALTVRALWDKARSSFWRVFVAMLVYGVLMMIGLFAISMGMGLGLAIVGAAMVSGSIATAIVMVMLVGLPALAIVLLFVAYIALLFPVFFFGDGDLFAAFSRSFQLLSGRWLSVVGLLMLVSLLSFMLGFLVNAPMFALSAALGLLTAKGGAGGVLVGGLVVLAGTLSGLVTPLLYTIPFVALAFQYFGLVEEKEHAGLRARVERLEAANVPAQSAPAAPDELSVPAEARWAPPERDDRPPPDEAESHDRWKHADRAEGANDEATSARSHDEKQEERE